MTHFRAQGQRLGGRICKAQLEPLETLDLLDLKSLADMHGFDFLPYPFMLTQPVPFDTVDDVAEHAAAVRERFTDGDLQLLSEYMATYAAADIRVSFHVQYIPRDTPSVRVMAHRKGGLGFFAEQRSDTDFVDLYDLSPYDLGSAVCDAAPVDKPGQHAEIVVPEYLPRPRVEFDSGDFSVRDMLDSRPEVTISAEEVSAYATVQSNWRQLRKWGPDRGKETLVWIRVREDGDYIYARGLASAHPMTRSLLHERIDRLIADDVAVLREMRRE